ncbi:hypothetical protein [Lentibacillus jeotgali]|uniref:hypothetical protein n=1 Tax=Lentibacillus jeotgali TaxID=558169 RepID=UPI0002626478|nr:hypothetical protein [Lentibacillus jeotgali]
MRLLAILLSLVVFFLTGLTLGMDRSHQDSEGSRNVEEVAVQEEEQVLVEKNVSEDDSSRQLLESPETSEHFTYKAASFLESTVKGFYELVVGAVYQLVQVFF